MALKQRLAILKQGLEDTQNKWRKTYIDCRQQGKTFEQFADIMYPIEILIEQYKEEIVMIEKAMENES